MEVSDRLLAELARPGAVVLIGEVHGTHEFPQLVGRLAELAVERDLPVLVGLEVPFNEQAAIDSFLGSDGEPDDVAALTASTFWHRPPEHDDGRAGAGLIELFTTARAAATKGALRVFAFDQPWVVEGTIATPEQARIWTMPRDQFMAETAIAAIEAGHVGRSPVFTVLLAGSIHSRIVRYQDTPEPHLAELLIDRFPDLLTLEGHWTGGQYRARTALRADIHDAGSIPTPPGSLGVHTDPELVQRYGHHGWVNVGVLTPSLPVD